MRCVAARDKSLESLGHLFDVSLLVNLDGSRLPESLNLDTSKLHCWTDCILAAASYDGGELLLSLLIILTDRWWEADENVISEDVDTRA